MKARFNVTPRVCDGLAFAVLSLEIQLQSLRAHKRPHKPAIDRCLESLLVVRTIGEAAFRVREVLP